jgi:hypothetical protein
MNMKKWSTPILLIAAMLSGIHQSKAELLFYDGFNYPAGNLAGQNGGTGFGTAWSSRKNTPTVYSPGLSYGSLTTAGGAVSNNTGGAVMQTSSTLSIPITSTSDVVTNGGSLYVSFLISEDAVNYADLTFFNDTSEILSMGNFYGSGSQPSLDYGFKANNATIVNSTVPIDTSGATHLLLMQLDYSTAGETLLSLYLDPTSDALDSPIATYAADNILVFNTVRLEVAGGNYLDEIRMGTTLADVLPGIGAVPEPSAWLLSIPGLGLLAALRRCRRGAVS